METMLAIALFSILLVSILSIVQSVSEGQKLAISSQNTQESIRYAFEVMSKEMRSAKRSDEACNPIGAVSSNNEIMNIYNGGAIGVGDVLYFKNKNDECVYYFLENDGGVSRLKIARDNDISDGIDNDFFITPNDVRATALEFYVDGNKIGDDYNVNIQPTVTMKMELESAMIKYKQKLIMQTSISLRHY